MSDLLSKITGALYGGAIGDAMGAPVEGWPPGKISERFTSVDEFLPPTHGQDPASGKGSGRITDDTLMTEALMKAYSAHLDHMDAYDFEKYLIPEIAERLVWLPERQANMPILERLWWPEKYPWLRLKVINAEPRSAGIGNCVNCGVAMYMMPVGAVNAGDPQSAYQEAAALGAAHNESYALEAAAVMAGAYAAGFGAESSIDRVLTTTIDHARDGTREAIYACLQVSDPQDNLSQWTQKVRQAVAPFDSRTGHVSDDHPLVSMPGVNDTNRPSRVMSIEELPVALAALKYGGGDFLKTIKAGVFYGRDCDSIAGMAGAMVGSIYGVDVIPDQLRVKVDHANRRKFSQQAIEFHSVVQAIFQKDLNRYNARIRSFEI